MQGVRVKGSKAVGVYGEREEKELTIGGRHRSRRGGSGGS